MGFAVHSAPFYNEVTVDKFRLIFALVFVSVKWFESGLSEGRKLFQQQMAVG